jgi:hypothetical protein
MAYGLVKPENECIPLRLMNTTDRPCKVKKNTIIAKMENVDTMETQIEYIHFQVLLNHRPLTDLFSWQR